MIFSVGHENMLIRQVTEMKYLGEGAITIKDNIRNEETKASLGVAPIEDKMTKLHKMVWPCKIEKNRK